MSALTTGYALGGVIMGVAAAAGLLFGGWRLTRWLVRFFDVVNGTKDRPGLAETLADHAAQLADGKEEFTAIKKHLAEQDEQLRALTYELPKNGKPTGDKIDVIYKWIQQQEQSPS